MVAASALAARAVATVPAWPVERVMKVRLLAFLLAVTGGLRWTVMTDRETLATVSRSHDDYLGHRGTEKEKGRGTLQTSALPLG